jgi:hypothetical protein
MTKRNKILLISLLFTLGAIIPLYFVLGQSATSQTWTSSIAYTNTENTSGSLTVTFFDGAGIAYPSDSIALNAHQSGTLLVGSVSSLSDGFAGSAVLSSTVELAAVYVEFVSGAESDNYDRKIYKGFTPSEASNTFYVPTVLKAIFGATSQVGIQNVDSSLDADLTLEFFAAGETIPTETVLHTVSPQSAYIFSMADVDVGTSFSGSLKITSSGGQIVASSQETWDADRFAYAFEGVASGQNTVYIPTMLCRFGPGESISYFAVQAVGGTADVEIKHYDRDTGLQVGTTANVQITDGSKSSQQPCMHGVPDGSLGSSVITSTGAPVIVVVKVADESGGIRTAYIGEGTGATTQALPYVRWNSDPGADFLGYIAVMNIGSVNATNITASYYNADGTLAATHTLASGGSPLAPSVKVNTHALLAGATDGSGNFVGSVVVQSDQPTLVTVRAARTVTGLGIINMFAEDYTGIPFTP